MINITDEDFRDVFKHVICTFLHREHIDNAYKSCKTMKTMIQIDWKMIYHDCQHQQPHNPGEYDKPMIAKDGSQEWYKEGKLHRDGGHAAVIMTDDTHYWHTNGKCHRDHDLPAVIHANGSKFWYIKDEQHRDHDRPAVIWSTGTQQWYKNNIIHRDGDMPAVITASGHKAWYMDGMRYFLNKN